MAREWIISDTHFGHKNIIGYENRPFGSVEEMDQAMIDRWNEMVKSPEDIVWHLGDVAMANSARFQEIMAQLRGRKRLIKGNHDERPDRWYLDRGFEFVSAYPLLLRGFFWLSHEPLYMNANMPYVNIHGHIHSKRYEGEQHINVSVEHLGYRPAMFDELVAHLKPQFPGD